jgi:hypothetical protein
MKTNVESLDSIAEESKILFKTRALTAHNKDFYNLFHTCLLRFK